MPLKDTVALVTCGPSGAGAAVALHFAREHADVVVADANETRGRHLVQAIRTDGGRAEFVYADVTRSDDVKLLVAATLEAFGRLDVCVCDLTASAPSSHDADAPESAFDRRYAAPLRRLYLVTHHVAPCFDTQGGGCFLHLVTREMPTHDRRDEGWGDVMQDAVVAASAALARALRGRAIRVNALRTSSEASDATYARMARAAALVGRGDEAGITGVCIDL